MFPLSVYVTQAMHGVVSGMLLFLVASGLTLVFGMMGILNIAHAGFYMLGAYLAYSTVHATGNFWLSLLVAPLVVGALGALVERFLLRRTHAFGQDSVIAAQCAIFGVLDFEEHPQSSAHSPFREKARVLRESTTPA